MKIRALRVRKAGANANGMSFVIYEAMPMKRLLYQIALSLEIPVRDPESGESTWQIVRMFHEPIDAPPLCSVGEEDPETAWFSFSGYMDSPSLKTELMVWEIVRTIVARKLRRMGYTVEERFDGDEGDELPPER